MAHIQPIRFDVKAAKERGVSDVDIANFLAEKANFDIGSARGKGVDDANIIQFITTGQQFRDVSQGQAFAEGVNRGVQDLVSTVVGSPADIFNFGLSQIGLGSDRPFAGSESIRRGLSSVLEPIGAERRGTEDLPPDVRPAGIAGEVIGGSAIPVAAPFAAARGVGPFKAAVKLAQEAPKSFLAAEAFSTAGAAGAGAAAEAVDPGDTVTRVLSEIAGGIISPGALIARTGNKALDQIKKLAQSFTKEGRENRAAQVIQGIVSEGGEDVDDIIRLLNKPDVAGRLTAGQKTGSPSLLAIENRLARQSEEFGGKAVDFAENSSRLLRGLVDDLTKTGDPKAAQIAVKLRGTYFDDIITKRIEEASKKAADATKRLGPGTKADLPDISVKTREFLGDALKEARKVETDLWGKIPKDISVKTDGLLGSVDKVRQKLLPSENLPTLVQDELTRILDEGTNVGEVLRFRSRLLALGRKAKAQGDFDLKNTLDTLSDGLLQDLDALPGGVADEARAFSRALHENFTSTFAGDALSANVKSADRIAPEILLERAFGSGGTQASTRFRQISTAADFPAGGFGKQVRGEQEKFLRIAAKDTIDISTGRVDSKKLSKFIDKNESILKRFPGLKKDLSTAASAETAFKSAQVSGKELSKALLERISFAEAANIDDPLVFVSKILTGENTRRKFTEIAKIAKRSGGDAVDGLRSATLQTAFAKSTNNQGVFSFKILDRILNKGLSKEDQGLISLLRQNKLIEPATVNRLKVLVNRAIQIEDALKNQKKLDKLQDDPDGLFDLVTRIVGAKIGAQGAAGTSGASLVAAGAGSKFARRVTQRIPANKVNEVLERAALDSKFMAVLLKKAKTQKQATELQRQINGFLIAAGIQLSEDTNQ